MGDTEVFSKIRRRVAVVLLNKDKKILLFSVTPESTGNYVRFKKQTWFTVGGGIEDDENLKEAAFREIKEETGLEVEKISRAEQYDFHELWKGENVRQENYVFVTESNIDYVCDSGWTCLEKKTIVDAKWWSLKELEESTDDFIPDDFSVRFKSLLQ